MANVLLVNAPHDGEEEVRRFSRPWPPLDLLNCAAILERDGHTVSLVDCRAMAVSESALALAASAADRVVITTTPLDRWQCPTLNTPAMFRFIRRFPLERTWIAGAHGTMRPEWVLSETGAAGVLLGEPEGGIRNVVASDGRTPGDGLASMCDGRLTANHLPPIDLSQLPAPAFHLLAMERYRYELLGSRFVLFETSRGCPFPCTFCSREMYGKPVRRKGLEQTLAEIECARRDTGFQCAYFIDLEFTFHRQPVLDLCEGILRRGVRFSWTCQTRLDQVDAELLRLMRRAGCRLIHLGVETGSERLIRVLKKGIARDQIVRQHSLIKAQGLQTALFFLLGHPGETHQEQQQTVAFACELDPTYASFHIVAPYPGTALHENGAPFDDPFPSYDNRDHNLGELERMRRYALRRFYLRPKYVYGALRPARLRLAVAQARLLLRFLE